MIREIRALLRDRRSLSRQQGFTLIEMSIVLAIIGLIVGGILKGQEVVNNARLKTQVAQIDAVKSAVFTFQDQFSYLPGDYAGAANNLGITSGNGNGDGAIAISGSVTLADSADTINTESVLAWADMTAANLLSGIQLPYGSSISQVSNSTNLSYAGKMSNTFLWLGTFTAQPNGGNSSTAVMARLQGVQSGALAAGKPQALREADAANLDRKYDDGNPATGSILVSSVSSTTDCSTGNAYTLSSAGSPNNTYCTMLWVIE